MKSIRVLLAVLAFSLLGVFLAGCGQQDDLIGQSINSSAPSSAIAAGGSGSLGQEAASATPGAVVFETEGQSRVLASAPDVKSANYEGFIETVNLPRSSFTMQQTTQASVSEIEGVEMVGAGASLTVVFDGSTVFIRSISNNTEKTIAYYMATKEDLQAEAYTVIWGTESNGTVYATQVLIMFTAA